MRPITGTLWALLVTMITMMLLASTALADGVMTGAFGTTVGATYRRLGGDVNYHGGDCRRVPSRGRQLQARRADQIRYLQGQISRYGSGTSQASRDFRRSLQREINKLTAGR